MHAFRCVLVLMLGLLISGSSSLSSPLAPPEGAAPAEELAGLWEAKRPFGPEIRGPLRIRAGANGWHAEIAGRSTEAKVTGDEIAFELPGGKGEFRGRFAANRAKIAGFWVQPRTTENGTRYASPVELTKTGRDAWRGEVSPVDDQMTFYLMVKPREDGSLAAFLRNPERNAGRFFNVDRLEREGDAVRLLGRGSGAGKSPVLAEGLFREGTLSIWLPSQGGTFDFARVAPDQASDFYPRGRPAAPYTYTPPSPGEDGWPTGSLEEAGISREGMRRFIQMIIDTPIDSVHASDIHGVLIARGGKLVLEEYFHGEHGGKPHDTRSAAKSLTSTLVGAAIQAGVPLAVSTPVYRVMNNGGFPASLEPRKRALTVEHLLTMSSGLDCDDRDPDSPGNEDVMQEQTAEPDYYRYTMALKMARDPGEKAVYCSVNPNLLGGVLSRASGRALPELFGNFVAGPLQIRRFHMNLAPTGDAYMGGGVRFLPRDFMKFGQLVLNGGTWNGRRVVSPEWSRRAVSPLVELRGLHYGYLWWVTEYPYKDRTVRAFFAGGNGGQVVMGFPELDLLIAFYGGNYSDPVLMVPQQVYVPKYILPAVSDSAPGRTKARERR